jgi:hypothetical protein
VTRGAVLLFLAACGGTTSATPPATDAGSDTVVEDAAPEASRESGGPSWCHEHMPPPAYCDDFDQGDLGATWDFFQQAPPGAATLDQAVFVSPPQSFGVVTKKLTGPDFGTILLRKTIPGPASRARLAFQLWADAPQPSGTLAVATLDLSTDHLFTLYLRDDDPSAPGPTLTEQPPGGAPAVRHPFATLPPLGAWTQVAIDLDAAGGSATLTIGDTTVLSAVSIAKATVDGPTIRIGVLALGPATPYTMRFDDVALDLTR